MSWSGLLRRNPAFTRLWLGEMASLVGDWLSFVALAALAVEQGAGVGGMAVAAVLVAQHLPALLAAPIAGVLADRLDRSRLLVGVHVLQGLLTVGMAVAAMGGHLGVVTALLALRSAAVAFDGPSRTAILRRVTLPDDLMRANQLSASTWSLAMVVGMAVGGFVAAVDPVLALAIDAGTFLTAAAIEATLPSVRAIGGTPRAESAWALVRARPDLRATVLAKVPTSLAGGAGLVVLALAAGHAPAWLGALHAIRGVGTGVGPLLAGLVIARWGLPLAWQGVRAVAVVGVAAVAVPVLAVPASLAWGVGSGAGWVLANVALQRAAPDDRIGRLQALDEALMTVALVIGAFLAGLAADAGVGLVAIAGVASAVGAALIVATSPIAAPPVPVPVPVSDGLSAALRTPSSGSAGPR